MCESAILVNPRYNGLEIDFITVFIITFLLTKGHFVSFHFVNWNNSRGFKIKTSSRDGLTKKSMNCANNTNIENIKL